MANPYYDPQSIAPILQQGAAQQAQYLAQPTGFSNALPAIGKLADAGFQLADNQQKRQTLMQAQQIYSDYLSKIDAGSPLTPQDHAMGRQAGMVLGIMPKEPPVKEDPYITDPAFLKQYGTTTPIRASEAKLLGRPNAGKQRVLVPDAQANAIRKKMGLPESDEPLYTDQLAGLKLLAPSPSGGLQTDKFVQSELDKYDRAINPINAQRGTLLGVVGANNARNLRAIQTLKDPKLVVQQLDNITSDIQAVMQGGPPHEAALAKGRYSNIYTRIADFKSQYMKAPDPINDPELTTKLSGILNDLQKVDNAIIKDNLRTQKAKISQTVKKYPGFADAAKQMEDSVISGSLLTEDQNSSKPGANDPLGIR